MTRRRFLLFAGLLIAALAFMRGAYAPRAEAAKCAAPAELVDFGRRLDALGQRFKDKSPLTIVAIGGASTAGTAAGNGGENAWPHRLQEALRYRHPGVPITIVNKGVAGQTARMMDKRFGADVFPNAPALVIWETGTMDAVHETDIEDFAADLRAGIAALQQHGAEIILVDMQYNPGTNSVIDYQPYLDALHQIADLEGIPVFRRFDIMKYWSESGAFDFVDVPPAKRTALAAQVYGCLAERLADAMDHATEPH